MRCAKMLPDDIFLFLLFNKMSKIMSGRINKAGKTMFKTLHIWGEGALPDIRKGYSQNTAAARK